MGGYGGLCKDGVFGWVYVGCDIGGSSRVYGVW